MTNITRLKSDLHLYGGPAKTNRYEVELPFISGAMSRLVNDEAPNGWEDAWTNAKNLSLFCRAANLPGRQILSQERIIMGNQEKIAYGYGAEDVSLTFMDRDDHPIRKYFQLWQELAFDLSDDRTTYHKPNFANTYQKSVKIYQLDNNNKRKFGVELQRAYPTTLGGVTFSAAAESAVVEYNVELSYKKWFQIKT